MPDLGALRSEGHHHYRRVEPPRQVRVRYPPQPPASGYEGAVYPVSREPGEVLGSRARFDRRRTRRRRRHALHLHATSNQRRTSPAGLGKGVTAAFCAAGGYREAGPEGVEMEQRLVALCDELGIALAGPNGQGWCPRPRACAPRSWLRSPPPERSPSQANRATSSPRSSTWPTTPGWGVRRRRRQRLSARHRRLCRVLHRRPGDGGVARVHRIRRRRA